MKRNLVWQIAVMGFTCFAAPAQASDPFVSQPQLQPPVSALTPDLTARAATAVGPQSKETAVADELNHWLDLLNKNLDRKLTAGFGGGLCGTGGASEASSTYGYQSDLPFYLRQISRNDQCLTAVPVALKQSIDPRIRACLALSLALAGDTTRKDELLFLMQHEADPQLRVMAAEALGKTQGSAAIPALQQMAATDPSVEITFYPPDGITVRSPGRKAAIEALLKLENYTDTAMLPKEDAIPLLALMLNDPGASRTAIQILEHLGGEKARTLLQAYVATRSASKSEEITRLVHEALRRLEKKHSASPPDHN